MLDQLTCAVIEQIKAHTTGWRLTPLVTVELDEQHQFWQGVCYLPPPTGMSAIDFYRQASSSSTANTSHILIKRAKSPLRVLGLAMVKHETRPLVRLDYWQASGWVAFDYTCKWARYGRRFEVPEGQHALALHRIHRIDKHSRKKAAKHLVDYLDLADLHFDFPLQTAIKVFELSWQHKPRKFGGVLMIDLKGHHFLADPAHAWN